MGVSEKLIPLINSLNANLIYYEVGVWRATTLTAIAKSCSNISKLVGIDSYEAYIDDINNSEKYSVSHELSKYNKAIAEQAIKNSKQHCKISLWVIDSEKAANLTDDNSVDVVFLDMHINPHSQYNDILNWYSKVKIGGILCGHGCVDKKNELDIYAALLLLGYTKESVNVLGNEVWWVKKH